jgi:hypothetical protein
MAKIRKSFIVSLTLLIAAVGAVYAWNSLPSSSTWEQGYSKISEGDPEKKVVEVLGKPTEIKNCYASSFSGNHEIRQQCAKEYWYIAFLQEWVYVIDKDGRVLAKWHSVSQ